MIMKIKYDPKVDALYIRFIDEPAECEVIRINEQVAINIGLGEKVVGIEILDASQLWGGFKEGKVELENVTPVK